MRETRRLNDGLVLLRGVLFVSGSLRGIRRRECYLCKKEMSIGAKAWRTVSESTKQTGGIMRGERICDSCVETILAVEVKA